MTPYPLPSKLRSEVPEQSGPTLTICLGPSRARKDIDGSHQGKSVRSPFWGGDLPEVRTASP